MSIFASTEEKEAPSPALDQITIKQLYMFLWKLFAATALFGIPIVLILWGLEYAVTH